MREPLKLGAVDAEDLEIISACLQDAILLLADMAYLRDRKQFVMMVNRFVWEGGAADAGDGEGSGHRERVLGLLSVDGVSGIRVLGIDQHDRSQMLSLLAVRSGDGYIDLLFAGGGAIRLAVDRIRCSLEDKSEPWPTIWQPHHPLGERDGDADR